jgi:hypothetical protein
MEKEISPKQKLAEIVKQLESSGHKVTDMSDKIKAIGFVSAHQKNDQPYTETQLRLEFIQKESQ